MFENVPIHLIPLGFLMLFFAIIGIAGNFVMILCPIISKKLRSPCHILISITCLLDGLHISGQLPFCVHLFGNLTSSQAQCFHMLLIPLIGIIPGAPLILATGIDRFIAIKYPIKYRFLQDHRGKYLIFQLIFPLFSIIFFITYEFIEEDNDVKRQILCSNTKALNGSVFVIFTFFSGILYIFVLILYANIYFLLKSRKSSDRYKKGFRSLASIVVLILCGWTCSMSISIAVILFIDDAELSDLIKMYAGIPVNTALTLNIFVFYSINSDYKIAIQSLLRCKKVDHINAETSTTNATTQHKMFQNSRF